MHIIYVCDLIRQKSTSLRYVVKYCSLFFKKCMCEVWQSKVYLTHTLFWKWRCMWMNEWITSHRATYEWITPYTYMTWMNHTIHIHEWMNYTIHIHEWMNYMNESHHTHTWMHYTIHIQFFENRAATKCCVFRWGRVLFTKRLNLVDVNFCVHVKYLYICTEFKEFFTHVRCAHGPRPFLWVRYMFREFVTWVMTIDMLFIFWLYEWCALRSRASAFWCLLQMRWIWLFFSLVCVCLCVCVCIQGNIKASPKE